MNKKKWVKPECLRVELVPEEAVLAGCKTVGLSVGPNKNNCRAASACLNTTS